MTTPLAPAPQTARYAKKREAILSAAALRFNQDGVRGATLAGIAASVGLVTNSVTYYYRKKEDLATACFHRAINAYDAVAAEAAGAAEAAKADAVDTRVQAYFDALTRRLAAIDEGRDPPIVSFSDIRALPEPHAAAVFDAYTAMFRRVRALLRGPQTDALAREDLNARAHILLSIAVSTRDWIGRYETDEYARVGRRIADIVLRGLRAPASSWEPAAGDAAWQLAGAVDSTSEAFLRAATVLVNEQGYRGASVEKISARLNVTKGSFYHHHDHKHDLISDCFERTFAVMRQALVLAESSPGSGWSRACAVARALVRFQLSDDGPLLRITATSALPDQAHRDRVRITMRRLTERMHALIVDGMMDGSIRPLDPAIAAQCASAAVNAAAELHRWVPGARLDNVAELYVRPTLEGLLCPGGAAGAGSAAAAQASAA